MSLFWQGVVTTIAVEAIILVIAVSISICRDSKKTK